MENYQRKYFFQVALTDINILLVCIIFLGCTDSNSVLLNPKKNTGIATSHDDLIPERVCQYLSSYFPAFQIPQKTHYNKSWWSFYDKKSIPYVVKTDINDDNLTDYAFILKNRDVTHAVILTGTGNSFKQWITTLPKTDGTESSGIHFGVTIQPPGQIDIVHPQIKSLILKSNGINLMDYENRACIFYWDYNELKLFLTSNKRISIHEK